MRQILTNALWIGNALDARAVAPLLALGIQAVVDLAANEPAIQYPRDIVYLRLPLNDGTGNEPVVLRLAVRSAAALAKSGMPTLVACSSGMSRSLAVAAGAIATAEGQDADDVLRRITSTGPHDVDPGLWAEIKSICAASG